MYDNSFVITLPLRNDQHKKQSFCVLQVNADNLMSTQTYDKTVFHLLQILDWSNPTEISKV